MADFSFQLSEFQLLLSGGHDGDGITPRALLGAAAQRKNLGEISSRPLEKMKTEPVATVIKRIMNGQPTANSELSCF